MRTTAAEGGPGPTGGGGASRPPSPWGRRLPLLVSLVGFAIVALVAGIALSGSEDAGLEGGVDVTDPARFDLPALDGTGRVRLADFEGQPLVVNFFASWCGPCKEELPDFAHASRKLDGKVAFVAVNSKEITASAGVALARAMGLAEAGITLARDVGGQDRSGLHDSYEVRNAMPITAFYDADGKLLDVHPGQLTADKLRDRLSSHYGVTL